VDKEGNSIKDQELHVVKQELEKLEHGEKKVCLSNLSISLPWERMV
jgi:hypothetical protein